MKNLVLFACAMFISSLSFSQIQKGTSILGGYIQVSTHSSKDSSSSETTSFNYGLSPVYDYMLTDNWAIGLGIGYSVSGNKNTYTIIPGETITQKYITGLFVVQPEVRYYHSWNDKFYCYGMGSINAGFGSSKSTFESPGTSTESKFSNSRFGVSISPGFTYLFHKSLGLDLRYGSLSYTMNTSKPEDGGSDTKTTDTDFGFSLNFQTLAIGLVYLINCDDDD